MCLLLLAVAWALLVCWFVDHGRMSARLHAALRAAAARDRERGGRHRAQEWPEEDPDGDGPGVHRQSPRPARAPSGEQTTVVRP